MALVLPSRVLGPPDSGVSVCLFTELTDICRHLHGTLSSLAGFIEARRLEDLDGKSGDSYW